jgi:hypothetical protein
MWGVHGFATEKEGNLYTAEVRTGRVQKYTPCKGCKSRFARRQAWRAFGRSGALFWKEWEAGFWLSTLSTGPAFPRLFFLRPKGTRWPIPASGLEKGMSSINRRLAIDCRAPIDLPVAFEDVGVLEPCSSLNFESSVCSTTTPTDPTAPMRVMKSLSARWSGHKTPRTLSRQRPHRSASRRESSR